MKAAPSKSVIVIFVIKLRASIDHRSFLLDSDESAGHSTSPESKRREAV